VAAVAVSLSWLLPVVKILQEYPPLWRKHYFSSGNHDHISELKRGKL
jgi:hypothetical protein